MDYNNRRFFQPACTLSLFWGVNVLASILFPNFPQTPGKYLQRRVETELASEKFTSLAALHNEFKSAVARLPESTVSAQSVVVECPFFFFFLDDSIPFTLEGSNSGTGRDSGLHSLLFSVNSTSLLL